MGYDNYLAVEKFNNDKWEKNRTIGLAGWKSIAYFLSDKFSSEIPKDSSEYVKNLYEENDGVPNIDFISVFLLSDILALNPNSIIKFGDKEDSLRNILTDDFFEVIFSLQNLGNPDHIRFIFYSRT